MDLKLLVHVLHRLISRRVLRVKPLRQIFNCAIGSDELDCVCIWNVD